MTRAQESLTLIIVATLLQQGLPLLVYLLLILFTIVAFELFLRLRMGMDAAALCKRGREAMQVLVRSEVTEEEKELFVRRASAEIFKSTWRFALKFLSIVLVLSLLFALTTIPLVDLRPAILEAVVSPVVLLALTMCVLCYAFMRKTILARQ